MKFLIKEIYKEMGEIGFLGAPIDGYGCAGKLCFIRANSA